MKLSVIIITKNEQQMLPECLESIKPVADEIIVVDTGSTDATNSIAASFSARIVTSTGTDYSAFRNDGLAAAAGDWVLYIDADERLTPELAAEINQLIGLPPAVYQIPRTNIYLGKQLRYGGWGGDKVIRLFYKPYLSGYRGALHEQPVYSGRLETTRSSLLHISHRDLSSMLDKTLVFTAYEADLRLRDNHPRMQVWRFIRVMLTEFWLRFIKLQAFRDGPEGVIDGLFQVFNSFVIYARLWESQLHASGPRR